MHHERENSLFDTVLKSGSLFDIRKVFLPCLTLVLNFIPYTTLPSSSLLLGTVTVASGYTSITAAQITDGRVPYTTAAAVHPIYSLNEQTGTTYTLNINDQDKMVSFDNSAGTAVTIPDNVFPVGATINLMQAGATGVTQISATNLKYAVGTKLRVQWSVATVYQYKLNYWVLTGDTKA